MTYLEKFKELFPDDDAEDIVNLFCPQDHFCCKFTHPDCMVVECSDCWNREYKGEKPR